MEDNLFKHNPKFHEEEEFCINCCIEYNRKNDKIAICDRKGYFKCKYKGEKDEITGCYKCEFYKE
jgi:hypothetical protein